MTRDLRRIASGLSFPESPRWREGDLYLSDFYTHRVLRYPKGSVKGEVVCEVPQQPSGLAWTPDGNLLVVSMLDRTLRRWDGTNLDIVADLSGMVSGPPNDMVADGGGRVWIGNFGDDAVEEDGFAPTTIVTVGPDGVVVVAAENLNFPNGMVLTDRGETLLVAETFAARITAFTVEAGGMLTGRRTWADLGHGDMWDVNNATKEQTVLPDGLALDAEGALWVADAKGSGVERIAEGGAVLDRVDTGELAVYGVALGGWNNRELVMCCAPPLLSEDPASNRHGEVLATTVSVPAGVVS
jgi:sugar lactone lactonase YvrE